MYTIYVRVVILEMLLAVVELQQLPLLLLKLHVHKNCSGAFASAFVVVVIACRMTQFVAVFFSHLIPVFFFLYLKTIYVKVPLGSAVACTASICL